MNGDRSGSGADEHADASWASESLPLSVRRELLERELNKLGFRRSGLPGGSAQQQLQTQADGHPQADADGGPHGQ